MPSMQQLAIQLRFIDRCVNNKCSLYSFVFSYSVFIRGLIPLETRSLLRALTHRDALRPTQVYMLWCVFADDSAQQLASFMLAHSRTIVDFGIEECYPMAFINDQLIANASSLTSLRVWADGRRGRYPIRTPIIALNVDTFDTIDLSGCDVHVDSIVALIDAWWQQPNRDVTISVADCPNVTSKDDVRYACVQRGIPLQVNGIIRVDKSILSFVCV